MKVGGSMYPIIFSIGSVNVYTHGVMMILGALLGGWVIFYLAKKENLPTNFLFDLLIYSFLAGLIGARILYLILYFNEFSSYKDMLLFWYGGLVSYGGIIGGLFVAYLFLKKRQENILKWFDFGIIGILMGWSVGRIGCLLNGDSAGIFSSKWMAIWGRIPTQLFESIWTLLVACGLFFLIQKKDRLRLPDGIIFLLGVGLYSIGRFIIDFWRLEDIIFLHLKAGQLGSLVIFSATLIILLLIIRGKRR